MDKQGSDAIGLTILGTISAFSVWSALSPSFFTIKKFADENDESSTRALRFGMKVGMLLDILLGVGLYLGYGKKGLYPGIATAATGIGLWTTYDLILKGKLQV